MKVKEIRRVVSSWCDVVNKRFAEIAEKPELIIEGIHFECNVDSLNDAFMRNLLDDPCCWYTDNRQVEEFTIDDTYTKCIESSPIEESLKYKNGRLLLDITFRYVFYRYDKFNCCTDEITEEEYERWKYDNGLSNYWDDSDL